MVRIGWDRQLERRSLGWRRRADGAEILASLLLVGWALAVQSNRIGLDASPDLRAIGATLLMPCKRNKA